MLRESGLLTPEQLEELAKEPQAQASDPRPLAKLILQRGWLTRFQINHVFQGHGKDLVLGQYRLLDRLGEGGMGQVYKAHHQPMNRVVALKVIRKERLSKPDAVQRFYREVQLAAQLSHPNIVLAFDAGQASNTHYLAMEYVDGTDLSKVVIKAGALPVPEACEYIRQAALGLQHALERGLVHRDIKPSNLLVTRASGKTVVKILDMGLARLEITGEGDHSLTRDGQIMGTPDYLSPEQAKNSKTVDIRADLYSLGCTFYFLLSSKPPFYHAKTLPEVLLAHQMEDPPPLVEVREDLPLEVDAIVCKLMAKRPEDRFQTPRELAELLAPYCTGGEEGRADSLASGGAPLSTASLFLTDLEKELRPAPRRVPSRTSAGTDRTLSSGSDSKAGGRRKQSRLLIGAGVAVALVAVIAVIIALSGRDTKDNQRSGSSGGAPSVAAADPNQTKGNATGGDGGAKPDQGGPQSKNDGNARSTRIARGPRLPPPAPPREISRELRRFVGHTGEVRSAAFSPDGTRLLSGGGGSTQQAGQTRVSDTSIRLWEVSTGHGLLDYKGHTHGVNWVAFSRDGKLAASAGGGKLVMNGKTETFDAVLRLWEVDTGRELRTCEGHLQEIRTVVFSPDGRHLLSCGADNTVRIWDVGTGKEVRRLQGDPGIPQMAVYSPDGLRILTGGMDKTIRLWDPSTGTEIRRWEAHTAGVRCVAFSPDGKRILSGGNDKTVRLWDVDSAEELLTLEGHGNWVGAVAFSPDGRQALSGGYDNVIRWWDIEHGWELYHLVGHEAWISSVAFSPEGRRALSASADKTLRLWDPAAETSPTPPDKSPPIVAKEAGPFQGHKGAIRALALSFDGRRLLSGGDDGLVHLWDAGTGKVLRRFPGHTGGITGLAFSPDGRRFLSGSVDKTVRSWDIDTGSYRAFAGHEAPVFSVAFSRDGRRAISGSGPGSGPGSASDKSGKAADNSVRIWDMETGKQVHKLDGHTRSVWSVALTPDGLRALSGGDDQTMRLWDAETGKELRVIPSESSVRSVAFSPDGRLALSGGGVMIRSKEKDKPGQPRDCVIRLWDLESAKEVGRFNGHEATIWSLAFSPDGRRILSGGGTAHQEDPYRLTADCVVRIWDVETAKELDRFTSHKSVIQSVIFSPDGRRAFSAGRDEIIRVWDLSKIPPPTVPLKPVTEVVPAPRFEGHAGPITQVLFLPDSLRFLTAGQDKTLRLWDVASGKNLLRMAGHKGEIKAIAITPDGRRAVSGDTEGAVRLWDLTTGLQLPGFVGKGGVDSLACAPDGGRVLYGSSDGFARLLAIDGPSKGVSQSFGASGSAINALALSPDGKHFVCGHADGKLRIRETDTGKEGGQFLGQHIGPIHAVAFAPDGRSVVTGGADRTVRLWTIIDGKEWRRYPGHTGAVLSVAYSTDGRYLLSGGMDKVVRLWDVKIANKPLRQFEGHADAVRGVALAPDGRHAVSVGENIRLWELTKPTATAGPKAN